MRLSARFFIQLMMQKNNNKFFCIISTKLVYCFSAWTVGAYFKLLKHNEIETSKKLYI